MHMLRTHLRGQLLWKYKVCTLSRVYACASALLFHCSFNVFEQTEGSETEAFSTRFDGGISQFFFVPPKCVIGHFSFILSRLSTDNQDSIFKAIEGNLGLSLKQEDAKRKTSLTQWWTFLLLVAVHVESPILPCDIIFLHSQTCIRWSPTKNGWGGGPT